MLRNILVVAALVVMFGSAQAAEPLERGGYFGAGIGTSLLDDDGAFGSFAQDDTDTSILLFGGYKFFKYLSVEARYSDFGTFNIGGANIDASAISAHAVATVPFGTSGWELYGQMGLGNVTFDFGSVAEEDQSALAGGIGVRFNPTQNVSIGIQTDVFVWEDDSFGRTYDVAVGGTALTARFIF